MSQAIPELGLTLSQNVSEAKIGIVTAKWNEEITSKLTEGAVEYLNKVGCKNVVKHTVPGSFELPLGCQYLFEVLNVDAVIAIGCVIKGETPHFEYISEAVTLGISNLNLRYMRPAVFSVLTVNTEEQALERCGGKQGHKGIEGAQTALYMLQLKETIKQNASQKSIGFGR